MMTDIIPSLLPMILGSALAPVWPILVLLMLRSRRGLLKATAFVAGVTTMRLLQGIIFSSVLGAASATEGGANGQSPVTSTLLMVLGILLLIAAIKTLRKEEDSDAPPPKWITMLDSLTPLKAFGFGAILTLVAVKLWVFTLSALGVIWSANLSSLSENIGAFLIFILGAQSLMILPLLLCAVAPRRSANLLQAASDWLEQYNRIITIAVSSVFGCLFLWKGISGLL